MAPGDVVYRHALSNHGDLLAFGTTTAIRLRSANRRPSLHDLVNGGIQLTSSLT